MEKELELLEEFLQMEEKKLDGELSQDERQVVEERIASLIKVMKMVNLIDHELTADDKKSLAGVAERLLNDTASAHVIEQDADDEIEVMVFDSIYRKVLAVLRIKKVFDCLHFKSFHFYG